MPQSTIETEPQSLIPDHLLVDIAYRALCAFGRDLTRETAATLLDLWRYREDLSPAVFAAVIERFDTAGGAR
jgi:hypothetical protein